MKVQLIKEIDGCLEGSNVRDMLFDSNINLGFIAYLGRLGKLIYNESFDKPFFRVIVRGKYTIKGSLGNRAIRILLPDNFDNFLIDELKNYADKFDN